MREGKQITTICTSRFSGRQHIPYSFIITKLISAFNGAGIESAVALNHLNCGKWVHVNQILEIIKIPFLAYVLLQLHLMHSHSSHFVDDETKQLDNFFLNGIKMQINLYSPLPDMVVSAMLFCFGKRTSNRNWIKPEINKCTITNNLSKIAQNARRKEWNEMTNLRHPNPVLPAMPNLVLGINATMKHKTIIIISFHPPHAKRIQHNISLNAVAVRLFAGFALSAIVGTPKSQSLSAECNWDSLIVYWLQLPYALLSYGIPLKRIETISI